VFGVPRGDHSEMLPVIGKVVMVDEMVFVDGKAAAIVAGQ
jgi:hypothetical protein